MKFILELLMICICVSLCTGKSKTYNILLALPCVTKSLHHLFASLAQSLVKEGHSITFFSSYNASVHHPNITHFQPGDFSSTKTLQYDYFQELSVMEVNTWPKEATSEAVHLFWNNEDVKQLYRLRNKFDAIIFPSYFNDILLPFLDGFKGVTILFCTPGIEYTTISRYHNYLSLSVTPVIVMPYDDNMDFWERSRNLFTFIALNVYFKVEFLPQFLHDMRMYFPNFDNPQSYYERTSLTLINGHFALDGPVPLLPNQVEVGTINVKKPKPLPKDIEEFMQGSGEAGVIYFSLGSFVLAKELPDSIKQVLVEAFGRVHQHVLWKYEDDDLDLPPNVMTKNWLPQQDILGHPKTKVFMSHCGNMGTQEAKFHGVPVLAMPIAFDQFRNAARMVRKGYGVALSWSDITVHKVLQAIHTLTNDSSYQERLRAVSHILQDQKDLPEDRAVWWIEYVIRHKGAPHLQFAGQRLHFFQYIMADVIAFWALSGFAVIIAIVYLIKYLRKRLLIMAKLKNE